MCGQTRFHWPARHGRTLIDAHELTRLREQLSRAGMHAWLRSERMSWTRSDGRPAQGEVRWFVATLTAIYAEANAEEALTPRETADAKREQEAFLRAVAKLVDLKLPKNLPNDLPVVGPKTTPGG